MKHFLILIATILFVGAVVLTLNRTVEAPVIFGEAADSFIYRHYTSANATSTIGTVAKNGSGQLGFISFNNGTPTAQVILYDGATTATSGLTVIAKFIPTASVGFHELNVSLEKGLVLELPGTFTGDITVGVR